METNDLDFRRFVVEPGSRLNDVIAQIDANGEGVALLLDADGRLVTTITDGDIRRALLDGIGLLERVQVLVDSGRLPPAGGPVTAPASDGSARYLQHMTERGLRHLPLVDDDEVVTGLALLDHLVQTYEMPLRAVVMAGGFGTRVRPLTTALPKPMLPIGEKPLLERTIQQLASAGIHHVNIAVHYQAEKVIDHFDDGQKFGVDIRYVTEERPLGTAGALRLLEESDEALLVINGDIITDVDFRAMIEYHQEAGADMTLAVRPYDIQVDFGVVDCVGSEVRAIREKPNMRLLINAGMYLVQPSALRHIPRAERFDMPDLANQLMDKGLKVAAFFVHEYWRDIGRLSDYANAQAEAAERATPD